MTRRSWLIPLVAIGAALLYRLWRPGSGRQAASGSWEFAGPMATVYDRLFSSFLDRFYARIARRLAAATPSGEALDVGCGPGRLAVHLARQAAGLSVTGIDLSPDMIALARRRAEEWNLSDRVHFQVADADALPFADCQFDLVVSTLSLHHWPDPARGLAEIRRVLKPDGRSYIYDVAGWILQLTHHGISQARILGDIPLATAGIEPVWSVGPVPVVTSFSFGR